MVAFHPPIREAEREVWVDLAARYRFTYDMSVQARLAEQSADVEAWWGVISRQPPPAPKTPRRPPGEGAPPFEALPERVRDIITAVKVETGIDLSRMAGRQTQPVTAARHEAIRRLGAMPWAYGGHPKSTQIGYWLGLDHTTVLDVLKAAVTVDGSPSR
jgi:hypothetical protein